MMHFLCNLCNDLVCNTAVSSGAAAPEPLQHIILKKDRQSKLDPKKIYTKVCDVISVST